MGNYVVKLTSPIYGTVVFDTLAADDTADAKSDAKTDSGFSWAQESQHGFLADPNVGKLLSDNKPDPVTNALPANPGE